MSQNVIVFDDVLLIFVSVDVGECLRRYSSAHELLA